MTYVRMLGLGLLFVALTVTATAQQGGAQQKKGKGKGKGGGHGQGPNGGVIFDLGKHHAEFTVDHAKKECAVLFLDGDQTGAKAMAVAAKELSLTTKETKTRDGKVVGTDPGLGNVANFEGTVVGEVDAKPAQGTFKET
jgi:hypothetical protein